MSLSLAEIGKVLEVRLGVGFGPVLFEIAVKRPNGSFEWAIVYELGVPGNSLKQ